MVKINPSERDDPLPPLPEPSFYRGVTFKMRKAGGKALLAAFAATPELELEQVIGPYHARSIAAKIFREMLKVEKETSNVQTQLFGSKTL